MHIVYDALDGEASERDLRPLGLYHWGKSGRSPPGASSAPIFAISAPTGSPRSPIAATPFATSREGRSGLPPPHDGAASCPARTPSLKSRLASACRQRSFLGVSQTIRIIGIDPGLRRTGWGVVESLGSRLSFIAAGTIRPEEYAFARRAALRHPRRASAA